MKPEQSTHGTLRSGKFYSFDAKASRTPNVTGKLNEIDMFQHEHSTLTLDPTSMPSRKGKSCGMLAMALKLVQNHGPRRLLSGAGATFTGYFLHGAFKYGSLVEWSEDETNNIRHYCILTVYGKRGCEYCSHVFAENQTSFVEGSMLLWFIGFVLCIYS